jgi:hypothetical protein
MGIISVAGASGRKYPINIAGDVPDEIERGRIQQYVAAQEQAFSQEYTAKTGKELQVDDGTAIGRGWERGMASAKTRLGTTQRIIGEQTGLDFLKNYGVDVEEQGRYEQLLAQLSQPTPLEYTDVKGLNSGFTFVGEQLGQTAPETGAIMGATLLGTIGGTAATGNPVAGTALGITAGALTASPTIFGGHVQRQEEEVKAGRKDKVDLTDALAATVGSATVEAIADRFLILGLIKPGQKIFSRTIGGLIEGAAVEAPTEILQQVLERAQAGLPLTDDAAMQEYITSGISGAVVGSSIRGPLAMAGIGTGDQPPPPPPPAVNPPAPAGPIAPVTQLGVTAQEPRQEDFPSTAQGIIDFNAALGQYYAGIAATTLTPEAKAAADAVAGVGAAPKINATAQELGEPFTFTTIDGKKTLVAPTFESLKQALGLDSKKYYSVDELNAAARDKGFDAPRAYLSGAKVYERLSAKRSSATPTVEDVNVVKPPVTTGSKSGTPATELGVGDGIGLDAAQGAAKLETPAAPGLGAAVSDTSTDNVPEGSQSAALMAQMAEWRADETAAKEARIAAAELEYNKKVRERSNILDRDTISENDNILYRPERAYRFIGTLGYADFLKSGFIRPAQNTKQAYDAAYFMKGKSSGRYGRGDSGAYIVETTPVEGAWRNDDASVYITPNSQLTKDDKIRIYKRKEDGSFEVVLDNIGDRALLPAQPAAEQTTAPSIEEAKIAAEADPAPGNEEFDFDFDEGFEALDAARRAEKVAVDLKVAAEREAAAKLKDAQLPSIDEGLPETPVSTSEQARVQRTATKAKMEANQAEREATRLAQNQQAAQQAEALRTENAAQYRQGDLPLSRVPAEYTPRTGALGMGKEAPEGAARQVIPATIRVSQASITPEKQVEPVTEKLWKEMGFSRAYSKLFFDLKNKPVNDPEVRRRLSNYAYSSKKPNPQQSKVGEWLQKNKVRMQSAPDVRSSAGQAMISQIEATSRGKLDADNLAAQREKDDLFSSKFAELSVEDPYLNDVSTPSDKQKATAVAYRKFEGEAPAEPVMYLTGRVFKDDQGKERAEEKKVSMLPHTAAGKYFERYKRIPDALNAIASDYTGDINAYKTDDQVSPAENTFFVGTGRIPATAARAWVDANMSEAVQNN